MTKSLLDLVPSGPVRSDPFDFKGQEARWRVLDGQEIIGCRVAAERRVMRMLVDEMGLEPKDAYPIVQAGGDTQREWFEYYVIGAAMTDKAGAPISMDVPDDIATRLADECSPIERARLIDDYLQFADEHDPSNLSDEEQEEIIAALGKGEDSILQRLGSNLLRSLLATLAPRLARAEMLAAQLEEREDLEARVGVLSDHLEELERELSQMRRSADGSDSPSG